MGNSDSSARKGLKPARKILLADEAYEKLLALLTSGRVDEGGRLPSEPTLALQLGVSRPVVREALSRLRADGVVVSRHGSGTYVQKRPDAALVTLTPQGGLADLLRAFELRVGLEGEAAALAAERRSRRDIAEVRRTLAELSRAVSRGTLGADSDLQFHLAVARSSHNPLFEVTLKSLVRPIFDGMKVARGLSLRRSRQRLELVQSEHQAIFTAIVDEDPDAARTAMRTHISNARVRILSDSAEPT